MSVIIAVKEKDFIYFGFDTQTTTGRTKINYLNETMFKVIKLDNKILFGFCGKVGLKQRILTKLSKLNIERNKQLTKKYIVNNIIPILTNELDDDEKIELSIIIAYKDKMYSISNTLTVIKRNEFVASGSGAFHVFYPLLSNQNLNVRTRLLKALNESASRVDSVSSPFVFIDTKDLKYEIVE